MTATNFRKFRVLLIEDNIHDIYLFKEAIKGLKHSIDLQVTLDGEQAVHYLQQFKQQARSGLPDLVVLDVNLPKIDGMEVLSFIKTDPQLNCIPVVMLTNSQAIADIKKAYGLRANCYLTKSTDLDLFFTHIRRVMDFWLDTVTLPRM